MGEAAASGMPLDRTNAYTKQYATSCKEVAQVWIWSPLEEGGLT